MSFPDVPSWRTLAVELAEASKLVGSVCLTHSDLPTGVQRGCPYCRIDAALNTYERKLKAESKAARVRAYFRDVEAGRT